MGGSDVLAELEKVRAELVAAWMAERNVSSVGEFAEALAQPYMRPACDAVGVDEGSCTLDQLAIVLGLAIVAVAVYTGGFRSGKAGRKRTSSASDDEGERRSSASRVPGTPPRARPPTQAEQRERGRSTVARRRGPRLEGGAV